MGAGTSFDLEGTMPNMAERFHEQRPDVLLIKERHLMTGDGLSIHVKSDANAINNFLSGPFAHDTIILTVNLR